MLALITLLAYLIGGLPFGYWFVRVVAGKDIRTIGSKNIGATNVDRVLGRKAALAVLVLDIVKGFFAVWLAAIICQGNSLALACAAVSVMLGHCYPPLLRFRGGKAVACFIGAFLYIAPLAIALTLPIFFLAVGISKYISLGSIAGVFTFPLIVWLAMHPPLPILIAAILAMVIIVYRHKANIARILSRTENVFSFGGTRK